MKKLLFDNYLYFSKGTTIGIAVIFEDVTVVYGADVPTLLDPTISSHNSLVQVGKYFHWYFGLLVKGCSLARYTC